MSITPEPGLVIRYDFLWKDEAWTGREEGTKANLAIIRVTKSNV